MQTIDNPIVKKLVTSFKAILILLWCSVLTYPALAQNKGLQQTFTSKESVFEDLRNIPKDERVQAALAIYRLNCRRIAEPLAMSALNALTNLARDIDDKQLECSVFEMRADYYSVNKGFNAISTSNYLQAITFARVNNLIPEIGAYQHKIGMYYYIYKYNVTACKYFLEAVDSFKAAGYDNVPEIGTLLSQMASFYYDLGDYDNARFCLEEALKHPMPVIRSRINAINTIGLIYRSQGNYTTALKYLNSALALSKQNRDTAWIGISTGNIGSVLFMQGKYAEAVPCLITDYELSLKYGESLNGVYALLRLAKVSMTNGNYAEAARQLSIVDGLLKGISNPLKANIDLNDLKAQLYEHNGNLTESIVYRKKMELDRDSLTHLNNFAAVERLKLSFAVAGHRVQLEKIKNDAQIDTLKRNVVIGFLVMLTIISLLIYNQRLLRAKKDKALLLLEKERVDEELKKAALELEVYTESLKKNNLAIEKFKKEISHLESKVINKDEAEHLEKLMQAHIMTDTNWEEFKTLFQKVHSGFFQAIKKSYPALSGTDTRILALMKLQLTNREMANMLGITLEGIKKSKQRLRKKMDLAEDIEIEDIIVTM